MKRVFSGIQPSGCLTLGNYLGVIRNWISMQENSECLFCIADLHTLAASRKSSTSLRSTTRLTAALYLASGLDPDKNIFFVQSSIPHHTELLWLLGHVMPLSWLNRMIQFKSRVKKNNFNPKMTSFALYAYPILMAADILLYKTTHVPIGEDQKQHLELARDIAILFNKTFREDLFTVPQPCIMDSGSRIMSLRDGNKKMSKSDLSDMSRINLVDSDDTIKVKILKARTDSFSFPSSLEDLKSRPETLNLVTIYSILSGKELVRVLDDYGEGPFLPFKLELVNLLIENLKPIRERTKEWLLGQRLDSLLEKGSRRALGIASESMKKIKDSMGFYQNINREKE